MSDQLALFDQVATPPAAQAPRGCTCRVYWPLDDEVCTICGGLFYINGRHVWADLPRRLPAPTPISPTL